MWEYAHNIIKLWSFRLNLDSNLEFFKGKSSPSPCFHVVFKSLAVYHRTQRSYRGPGKDLDIFLPQRCMPDVNKHQHIHFISPRLPKWHEDDKVQGVQKLKQSIAGMLHQKSTRRFLTNSSPRLSSRLIEPYLHIILSMLLKVPIRHNIVMLHHILPEYMKWQIRHETQNIYQTLNQAYQLT